MQVEDKCAGFACLREGMYKLGYRKDLRQYRSESLSLSPSLLVPLNYNKDAKVKNAKALLL